ncbi:MAG TPA: proline--tRNA ligase [Desulfitobacteriaceae bacterium]|jgi:prolyl-tRNA synthetase|nr:proline--tRNA ligase [Desulfitobacteriaceae bacterium]
MLVSQLLNPTLREVPAEAEIISHKLMLRAGLIRKAAAGIYTYLPLGLRVLRKIEKIVREEMDAKGGQEILLPIIQPSEPWQETGRWNVYGEEMFRLKDRHDREFCLGPTHEEIVTDLIRGEVRSYKQLPLLLYQIQNKYRDERRPRFGLMRGREFIMKDLYSFDRDQAGLEVSYQKMYDAYCRIFSRCGLTFRPVEADAGAIGGSGGTHEFMVLAESGEAAVVYCPACDYAANVEKAECRPEPAPDSPATAPPTMVDTPGVKTIEQVSVFLKIPATQLVKSLLYQGDDKVFLVLLRGDRELNEVKLNNALGGFISLQLASPETVCSILGCEPGFVGPVDIPKDLTVIADLEVKFMPKVVCGANQADQHYININPEQDFRIDQEFDLRMIENGEKCPQCSTPLQEARGIEVGQVFKLGDKYSKALQATYYDESGKEQLCIMGCYGIGLSRTIAAAIEQNYDQDGIIWSMSIAPYHCIIVPVNMKDALVKEAAEKLYAQLQETGVEVVLDDRDERPGVKFKDADLVGYPLRVIIGSKTLAAGQAELRQRCSGETELINLQDLVNIIKEKVDQELKNVN